MNAFKQFSVILLVGLVLSALAVDGFAREIRVTTAPDLIACAAGLAVAAGPDAGVVSANGDECVLDPGNYPVAASVFVCNMNMTIRSRSGANATTVTAGGAFPVFTVVQPGVDIGGDGENSGMTITGGTIGVLVTAGPGPCAGPAGIANRDITIQNNFINGIAGPGISVTTPAPIDDFRVRGGEVRGNLGAGFFISPAVGAVDNLDITDITFDGNGTGGAPNILIVNAGSLRSVLVSEAEILRGGTDGIAVGIPVTEVSDFGVQGSTFQANGFTAAFGNGVLFANGGQVEATFTDNRFTGNGCSAIFFDGASAIPIGVPAFGGLVTDVETTIADNLIDENGQAGACPGVSFFNGGDVEDLVASGNEVRQNSADGFLIGNGGDFSDGDVRNNMFLNNGNLPAFGALGALGSGFTAWPGQSLEGNTFQGNFAQGNRFHGVFLASLGGDAEGNTFDGERYQSNGVGLGGGGGGFVPAGLEISSFGDVTDTVIRNMEANQNGGSGVYLDAIGTNLVALGLIPGPANNGDVMNTSVHDSTFKFNGASAPAGAGDGLFLLGDNVDVVESENNVMDQNDDHGLFVSAQDDADSVMVNRGTYNFNDSNNDTIGSGVTVEAANDVRNVTITGIEASNNKDGIKVEAKGENIADVQITNNPKVCDNTDSGIEVESSDDISDLEITNNSGGGNSTNIRLIANDTSNNVTIDPNNFGANCQTGSPGPGPTPPGPGSGFTVTGFNLSSSNVAVNANVTITTTVRNAGASSLTETVRVLIKNSGGATVREESFPTTLNGGAETTISLIHSFSSAGNFSIQVLTGSDSRTGTVTVGGGSGSPGGSASIEKALDANNNSRIDEDEMLTALALWITATPVPGTNGEVIDDPKIRAIVVLWITAAPIPGSAAPASVPVTQALNVRSTTLSQDGGQLVLNAHGQNISETTIQVFDLSGQRVLEHTSGGNQLRFSPFNEMGQRWANGVYLYAVTAKGFNGQTYRSEVKKFAVLN